MTICSSITYNNSCTNESNSYCISTEGQIYTSDGCSIDDGVNIFAKSSNGNNQKLDFGTNISNALIYDCRQSLCSQLISSYYLYSHTTMYYSNAIGECSDVTLSISAGYYLSGIAINSLRESYFTYKKLLHCFSGEVSSCETLVTGYLIEGFFLDKNNSENVISCNNEKCILHISLYYN